ncbi:uncharacterized protein LOC144281032 [Canis aureus]
MKPLGRRVSGFSQAPALAPPLPGWASASITRRGPAPRAVGSPGWPRTPFIPRPRPRPRHPAPSAGPRPFPPHPPPAPSPLRVAAHPSQQPQTPGGLPRSPRPWLDASDSRSQSARPALPLLPRRPMRRDLGSTSSPAERTQHSIHDSSTGAVPLEDQDLTGGMVEQTAGSTLNAAE